MTAKTQRILPRIPVPAFLRIDRDQEVAALRAQVAQLKAALRRLCYCDTNDIGASDVSCSAYPMRDYDLLAEVVAEEYLRELEIERDPDVVAQRRD